MTTLSIVLHIIETCVGLVQGIIADSDTPDELRAMALSRLDDATNKIRGLDELEAAEQSELDAAVPPQ